MILISILGKTWIPVMSDPEKPMPDSESPNIFFRYTDQFELIHCFESNINSISRAFWRPQSFQAGFYLLGDVAIVAKEGSPPATKALLVSSYHKNEDALKPPTGFGEVYNYKIDLDQDVHIYEMGAPEGYTALGCVVVKGSTVPDPETCQYRCVKNEYLVEGALSFLWSLEEKTEHDMNNLQSIIRGEGDALGLYANTFAVTGCLLYPVYLLKDDGKKVKYAQNLPTFQILKSPNDLNLFAVSELGLIWSGSGFSVWRAVSKDGFYPVGDIVVKGKKKPKKGYLVKPTDSDYYKTDALQQPVSYSKIYGNGNWNSTNDVQFWRPNPPAGYVALGYVATKNGEYPSLEDVYCVARRNVVAGSSENWVQIPTPNWTHNRGITLYEALAAPNNPAQQTVRGIGASPPVSPFFLSAGRLDYFPDGPIKKIYIYDVSYDEDNPDPKYKTIEQHSVTLTNSTGISQKITRKFTCTLTEEQYLVINLQNIYAGIVSDITSRIPEFGPAGKMIRPSHSTTVTFKTGEYIRKESKEDVTAELNLPPNSTTIVTVSSKKYEAHAIPFTARMKRVYYNGSENTVAITGKYFVKAMRGVDVSYTPMIL